MTSKPVAFLLADLGVTKTHFNSIEEARSFGQEFFPWYNTAHRHAGIGLLTPEALHHGRASERHATRAAVLNGAHTTHPERFVNRAPVPPPIPTAVYINPPKPVSTEEISQ